MCVKDEILRAKLDGELPHAESVSVDEHLAACADCRRRAEAIAAQSARVHTLLSELAPVADEAPEGGQRAWTRFKARQSTAAGPFFLRRAFAGRLRLAWGILAVLVFVVAAMSFAPVRSWADKFLGLFRVQKITVIGIDPNRIAGLSGDNRPGKLISQLISDNVVVTKEAGFPEIVSDAEEASRLAEFQVRLPALRTDPPQIKVEDDRAFHMTIDRARLQAILEEVRRPDLQIPASVDGATVSITLPKVVVASYGNCFNADRMKAPPSEADWDHCLVLAQFPSPTVITPPDLHLAEIAELALELLGMPREKARAFSESVDWTSTLVIPIPRDFAAYEEVNVAGVKGTLIRQRYGAHRRPAGYTLLWVQDDIVYSLAGYGDFQQAVPLAESLR